jgi:hypothetical protein
MRKPTRKYSSPLSMAMTMASLTATSWETIFRRTLLMAQGTCSPAEYRRMTAEKVAAMRTSVGALMSGKSQAAMLAPFVSRTRANAKRLRRKT